MCEILGDQLLYKYSYQKLPRTSKKNHLMLKTRFYIKNKYLNSVSLILFSCGRTLLTSVMLREGPLHKLFSSFCQLEEEGSICHPQCLLASPGTRGPPLNCQQMNSCPVDGGRWEIYCVKMLRWIFFWSRNWLSFTQSTHLVLSIQYTAILHACK